MNTKGNEMKIYCMSIFLLAILIFPVTTDPAKADELYYGGNILTMSLEGDASVEAVLVRDEHIEAAGNLEDIKSISGKDVKQIDLQGATMLPGFIAVHTHPDISAYLYDFVDLSGFSNSTPQQVWQKLRDAVANTKKGNWIFCKGFDPMLVTGLKAPDIKFLDEIAPNNPIAIIAQSLHSGWTNSLGFKAAGIDAKTPDPAPSSFYGKDAKGNLTGFISETEALLPFTEIALKTYDIPGNVMKVFDDHISKGITTVTTMGMLGKNNKPLMMYEYLSTKHPKLLPRLLDAIGLLPDKKPTVRHFIYLRYQNEDLFPKNLDNGDDFFHIAGLKLWYDGSPYTGSMYLEGTYMNSELMMEGLNIPCNHNGKPVMKRDLFKNYLKKYHDLGWQISIHSQGDQSSREVLEMMKDIMSDPPNRDHRHRIEHGILLPTDLLDSMNDLGMTASIHMNHLYYYGRSLRDEIIGPERAEKMLPLGSLYRKKHFFSLHADAPMYEENPLSLLQTAVTRKTREGDVIGKQEQISVEDGLKALTIYPAWQLKMENKIGSIEAGKYADFVILDKNPLSANPDALRDIQILQTIIAGKKMR